MRKQMIENAAYEVATQIRAVEDSIDSTLAEIAELQSRMMHANSVAHVGPAPIHSALQELSTALGSLVDARGAIVGCHMQLVDAKDKVPGLRTVGFGDGTECPPKTAQADLRIVA
ncbi:MAG: hypothetical protein ABI454_03520 [Sphingomicrobium sp.]